MNSERRAVAVEIFIEDETGAAGGYLEAARRAVLAVMVAEGFTVGEVGVTFVGEEDMRALNRAHRGVDSVTDVLSFPMFERRAEIRKEAAPPLGDIVICVRRAEEQAEAYGHAVLREVGFLAAHGALHLLCYDHETPEDEAEMTLKQERALQSIGLRRDVDEKNDLGTGHADHGVGAGGLR